MKFEVHECMYDWIMLEFLNHKTSYPNSVAYIWQRLETPTPNETQNQPRGYLLAARWSKMKTFAQDYTNTTALGNRDHALNTMTFIPLTSKPALSPVCCYANILLLIKYKDGMLESRDIRQYNSIRSFMSLRGFRYQNHPVSKICIIYPNAVGIIVYPSSCYEFIALRSDKVNCIHVFQLYTFRFRSK